jgi:hypothetical protein
LLSVEVDAGEVGFYCRFDAIFGTQIIEGDWIQAEVNFQEGENVNGYLIFAQDRILGAQMFDSLPDVLHTVGF